MKYLSPVKILTGTFIREETYKYSFDINHRDTYVNGRHQQSQMWETKKHIYQRLERTHKK